MALGKRQDALYAEWGRLLSELHKQPGISLDIEKHKDDIVRSFACMRVVVAQEIGRRLLVGDEGTRS